MLSKISCSIEAVQGYIVRAEVPRVLGNGFVLA
jgi:hypothetical protein